MSLKSSTFLFSIFSFLFLLLVGGFFISTHFVSADTYKCDTPAEKQACTQLLNQTEAEITNLASQLDTVKATGSSLARDKQILDIQIKQTKLQIKAHELTIANLGKDIVAKQNTIKTLEQKIDDGRQSLSQIMRKTNEIDGFTLPEVFLGNQKFSDAFADLDSFDSVKTAMADTFNELRDAKQANEDAKATLGKQRDKEIDTRVSIETEKKKVESASAEKQRLLNLNKNAQAGYQKIIADKSAQVAQIKAALFKLAGGGSAIQFGTALQYAKEAAAKTGVDPAFVLAILTQESNLGANVGSCYLTDTSTGAGIKVSSGASIDKVMKPTRDVTPFLAITSALGRDYKTTRVSCPIGGYGYGGAMGPAQFIPSTWVLFQDRIESALNISASDPWNPEHAIMASSMYLTDLGAVGTSYSAQIRAACKYYGTGGSSCSYGNSVMGLKAKIQGNIDILDGN